MPNRRTVCALVAAWLLAINALPATAGECTDPVLTLDTSSGAIDVRLFPDAAPRTIQWLLRSDDYDANLAFDVTQPNVVVRTLPLLGPDSRQPIELSAAALGLHEQKLATTGLAHDAIQNDLIPAYRRSLKGDVMSDTLRAWLAHWFNTYDPSFLLGTPISDLHAALGIPDTPGLRSRAVTRGSVALVPADVGQVSSKLAFFLSDAPAKTGRWPVVGEVTDGIDILVALSRAPRHPRSLAHSSAYKPVNPVSITRISHRCLSDSDSE